MFYLCIFFLLRGNSLLGLNCKGMIGQKNISHIWHLSLRTPMYGYLHSTYLVGIIIYKYVIRLFVPILGILFYIIYIIFKYVIENRRNFYEIMYTKNTHY